MALPAPVDRRHRKAARTQVAHRLEIFFDALGAAVKETHGALAVERWRPARKAQLGAIGRLDGPGHDVVRNRVGGDGNQRHGKGETAWKGLRRVRKLLK